MSADHQQQPRSVAEFPMQSFDFPGTTVNFSHAVVQPGHLEPPENGSNFTADGPPFLWTNPDSLEMIMRQDEPRIGTGFGRGPDEGLGSAFVAFVGEDSRGGASGFEENLSNAQPRIAAQITSTTTHHSPHPPNLPLGTSGPSLPPPPIQVSTISNNPPLTPSHQGLAPPLAATTVGPEYPSGLWNDGTSALSKWYDEDLDVRVKQQRASCQPRREGSNAFRTATSSDVRRVFDATLEQNTSTVAYATSSLPVHCGEGFGDTVMTKQQPTSQDSRTSDGVNGGGPLNRDATTLHEANSDTAPQIWEPRPVHRRNAAAHLILSHQPYRTSSFHEMPPLTAPATSFREDPRLPPDFRQPAQHYLGSGMYPTSSRVDHGASHMADGAFDGGREGDVATTADGIGGETPDGVKARQVPGWNAPVDLNLIPDVHHSSYNVSEMPPPTAPATSYGEDMYLHREGPPANRYHLAPRSSATPIHPIQGQPFAFSMVGSGEDYFNYQPAAHHDGGPQAHRNGGTHDQFQPDPPLGSQLLGLSAEELVSPRTVALAPPRLRPITPYRYLPVCFPYIPHAYGGPIEMLSWAFPPRHPAPPTAMYPGRQSYPSSIWTNSVPPTVRSTPLSFALPLSGPSAPGQEKRSMDSLPQLPVVREPSVRFNSGHKTATKFRENLEEIRSYLSGSSSDPGQSRDASQPTPTPITMASRTTIARTSVSTARPVLPPPPKRVHKRKSDHIKKEREGRPAVEDFEIDQDLKAVAPAREQPRLSQTSNRKSGSRGGRGKRQNSLRIMKTALATVRASTSSEQPLSRLRDKATSGATSENRKGRSVSVTKSDSPLPPVRASCSYELRPATQQPQPRYESASDNEVGMKNKKGHSKKARRS